MTQFAAHFGRRTSGDAMPIRRRMVFYVFAAISLAALFDAFFFRHPIGFTAGVFTLIVELLLLLRSPSIVRTWSGRIVAAALVGLVAAMVLSPSFLNISMALMLLGFLAMIARSQWVAGAGEWLMRWLLFTIGIFFGPCRDAFMIARLFVRHPRAIPGLLIGGLKWILPLALSGIFLLLFTVANPVLWEWALDGLRHLRDLLVTIPEWLTPGRLLEWALVMAGVWGMLRVRGEKASRPIVQEHAGIELLSARMIVRCLLAFNAVFALQSAMDVAYLWGGMRLPAGMSYASYAHRGAYPLVATALLAGLFVMITFRTRGEGQRSTWARILVFAWIAQNLLLMVSTLWRLFLYIGAYGLTYWRLSTMIWVALLGAGFLWIVLRIARQKSNAWMLRRTLLTAGAILYACCFFNFPAIISSFNVRHCAEVSGMGVELDLDYLRDLGPESIPAITKALPHLGEQKQSDARAVRAELAAELRSDMADWRGWTWRRARLLEATKCRRHFTNFGEVSYANHSGPIDGDVLWRA